MGKATVPYRPNGTWGLVQGLSATPGAFGTLAMTPLSLWDEERKQREAPAVQKALDLFGSIGPAFIHADEADTNTNWAAGATSFNIASIAASYGVGAAIKSGLSRANWPQ